MGFWSDALHLALDHFKAYVWSSVVAHNLALLVRLKPA
jgi:heme exporter protein D